MSLAFASMLTKLNFYNFFPPFLIISCIIIHETGITRLHFVINNSFVCTVELKIKQTETLIDNLPIEAIPSTEEDFWNAKSISEVLRPISVHFQGQLKDIKQSLRSLRNTVLGVILLVNFMWIILLYSLSFPELEDYGLDRRGFLLLFLSVYSLIIMIQFLALLCHRVVTVIHYLGRAKPEEVSKQCQAVSGAQ